jgi:hypothetical protein
MLEMVTVIAPVVLYEPPDDQWPLLEQEVPIVSYSSGKSVAS